MEAETETAQAALETAEGNGKLKPTSLAELKRSRELTVPGPSGHIYRIRPVNLQRHALAGGFPAALRELAVRQALGQAAISGADDTTELLERASELGDYMDAVVLQVIVAPKLEQEDLELLPPVDYDWAVNVAMGNTSTDGNGEPLWGSEQLGRFREAATP